MKLVVLASGRGSNFSAIADAITNKMIPNTQIIGLISNKLSAPVLKLAESRNVPTHVINSKSFRDNETFDREKYEETLGRLLKELSPDFICLAGYMLLLGKNLVSQWPNKIINIHPSLLPSFKGLKAQKQALEAGVLWTGCTVHLVTPELDDGPILAQNVLEIKPNDSLELLEQRLLTVEHRTYVEALKKLVTQSFELHGKRIIWKSQEKIM